MSATKRARKSSSCEERIIQVCGAPQNTKGCAQDEVEKALSDVPKQSIMEALNALLSRGKLVPCPDVNRKILFRLQNDEVAAKFHGLRVEDRLVYQEIERAGSSGISTKDLGARANLQPPQITKVLQPPPSTLPIPCLPALHHLAPCRSAGLP